MTAQNDDLLYIKTQNKGNNNILKNRKDEEMRCKINLI